jgi:hypothetical protein
MFFRKVKYNTTTRVMGRYLAEIMIIFVGITISFVFEQWREEQKKKSERIELVKSLLADVNALKVKLKEDLGGSLNWISQLDSLRNQRTSKKFSDRQLNWFYKMASGQIIFLFDPYSPTYMSSVANGTLNELPEHIKNQLYIVYRVKLPFFELLYNQQQENILSFRNTTMITSNSYLYETKPSAIHPDMKLLSVEIQRSDYGNFINQIIITEREVLKLNEEASASLTELENSLHEYINANK